MSELLKDAYKRKKKLLESDVVSMEEEEVKTFRNRYKEILTRGRKEYEAAIEGKTNITYYTEERRLLKRLEEYIDEHLRFLTDFAAPFSNNAAEHGAKHIKGKKKTSGGFRSDRGTDNYAVIASVIATLRKHGMNVFSAISETFRGHAPRFGINGNSDTG